MIVQTVLMDMEFDNTIDKLIENVVVSISISKEHVAEIGRAILTVK